ncbi:MAG TPA: serine hydrolase [Polaromonas sp.]|uniref:serine hydrolase domain-containing protein n=1 Tax=Polaromonas sp. TaxID=1869339 RepID=UPI002D3008C8|nr:serine hydrolase [Polaromonas sp.]HYW57736.1 serine hydrolase [Polaromonas sp.]
MSVFTRSLSQAAIAAALFCMASAGLAQAPQLPAPESTDPVTLELMKGFPPPPDKVVRLGTILKYPNARWAFHHLRELGPTANISRGARPASALPAASRELDGVWLEDDKGTRLNIADWERSTYTDGLLVMHKGKVVYEKTFAGMNALQPHVAWSMSKSFTGLLATLLIKEGTVDANALISSYLPELKDSAWADATVQQALDMTTGVQYRENFADPSSGIFQYLIAAGLLPAPANYAGARTVTDFLKTVKKEGEHGGGFQYKTVDTEVLGWLLQRVTGKSYATLMSERIWSRIGAQEDAYVWADPIGTQLTSIGFNASLRDLARFGEMMRLGGRFNGQQVVPASVIAEIRKGADPEKFKSAGMPMRAGYSYHNQWWIPHDADGSYEAKGLNGQHIHINPAAGLVIVKLSSHPIGNTAFTHALDRRAFAAIAASLRGR